MDLTTSLPSTIDSSVKILFLDAHLHLPEKQTLQQLWGRIFWIKNSDYSIWLRMSLYIMN